MKPFFNFSLISVVALCTAAVILVACGYKTAPPTPFDAYANGHTQLIFKTISFNQFVVKGTVAENNSEYLDQHKIYLVKGKGKFYFDLSNLEVDDQKTKDSVNQTELHLKIKKGVSLPKCIVSVDVDLNADDIYPIEIVNPKKISKEDAQKLAFIPAAAEGAIASVVGGKVGEIAKQFSINPIRRTAIKVGAQAASTAAGTIHGYIWSKNFFCGKALVKSDGMEETDDLLNEIKVMMAAELLDLSDKKKLDDTSEQFKREIQTQLGLVMRRMGWNDTFIEFK